MAMASGAIHRVKKRHSQKILAPYFLSAEKKSSCFTTSPAKTEMAMPPIGSKRLVERSATKSKIVKRSNTLKSAKTLNDRAQKILPKKVRNPIKNTALWRFSFDFSMRKSTSGSAKDNEDDKAAKKSKIKNKLAQKAPKGIVANTMGKETNISPGPWLGERPFSKIRGKIARPAKRATSTSSAATIKTDLATDAFLGK